MTQTTRFVISSYDIAAQDENLASTATNTITRFTNPNAVVKSKFFKKTGKKGFKLSSTPALRMGAGTLLGANSNASTVAYDTFTIQFPYYFTKSTNTTWKKVEIEKIHLFQKKSTTETDYVQRCLEQKTGTDGQTANTITTTYFGDDKFKPLEATVHSTLARTLTNFDQFICRTNTDYYVSPRDFQINDYEQEFDFWFYTLDGDVVDVSPEKTVAIYEFKLTY